MERLNRRSCCAAVGGGRSQGNVRRYAILDASVNYKKGRVMEAINWDAVSAISEALGLVFVFVTLMYLAIQVRQGNVFQKASADMAKANATQNAVQTWSTLRQMLTDGELSEIWLKANNDEALTAKEKIRLYGIVAELTYSSLAAYENWRVAGDKVQQNVPPSVIARTIGGSAILRNAWSEMAEELRSYGLAGFASEVDRRLEPHNAPS